MDKALQRLVMMQPKAGGTVDNVASAVVVVDVAIVTEVAVVAAALVVLGVAAAETLLEISGPVQGCCPHNELFKAVWG